MTQSPEGSTNPLSCAVLPASVGEIVLHLEHSFAVPASAGTAIALQTLSSALGPGAQLVEGAATPLSAALNTLIATPAGSTIALARQALLSPLLAVQNKMWALAGEEPPLLLDPSDGLAAADGRARQLPVVVQTEPDYADLQAALERSFDRTVFTVHDAGSWARFWPELQADRNGSRLRIYLQLLAGRSRLPRQGKPIREVITTLMEARPQSLALHEFIAALPPDLASRFLAVDLGTAPVTWPAETGLPPILADQWSDLVRRLFARRGTGVPQLVTVGDDSRRLLNQFHMEMLAQVADRPVAEQELMLNWPTLARRIALMLHQTEDNVNQPIQPAHALAGISLALGYGGQMLTWRGRAERERLAARQLEDRQRVLAKLKQLGETEFRTLYRCFDNQAIARWAPVLDGLLAEGLVIELPDGRISLAEHQLRRLVCV